MRQFVVWLFLAAILGAAATSTAFSARAFATGDVLPGIAAGVVALVVWAAFLASALVAKVRWHALKHPGDSGRGASNKNMAPPAS